MRSYKKVAVSALFLCVSASSTIEVLGAQMPAEKLGTISFPNSGNAAAQAPFIKGMLLYHSFEYGPAAENFKAAQKADPSFALAYVGEALTYTHQVWNQQDMAAGRAALAKLASTPAQRLAAAKTPREQGYLGLAELLYGEGSKARRDTLFTEAAERLSRANPTDDEAKMLHAIGLLGLNQAVRDFPTYMRAGALAEEVLRRNPEHPAAAHFIIHAFDDPIHAPLGLWAARAYSKIAAGAPHAVHMTSHIFVALGMWDDVIEQNQVASGHDHDRWQAGHYTIWLGYGYMQAGRFDDARKHIELLQKNAANSPNPGAAASGLRTLKAHYYVATGTPFPADALSRAPAVAGGQGSGFRLDLASASLQFVTGLEAVRSKNLGLVPPILALLDSGATQNAMVAARPEIAILAKELRAAAASMAGKHDEAIALARAAADAEEAMPYEFGPPQFVLPTHELLGEVFLAAEKGAEAQAAFKKSLARMPGRARSLLGLANAAMLAGDRATATTAVAQLKANWHAADPKLRELPMFGKMDGSREQ